MNDFSRLELEPFSTRIQFVAPEDLPFAEWRVHVSYFLEKLAGRCDRQASPFIGHIKMIALFPGNRYLRANIVSPDAGADVEGNAPEFFREMAATVTILVCGMTCRAVQGVLSDTLTQVNTGFRGSVFESVFRAQP